MIKLKDILKESQMTMRDAFYQTGDGIGNLEWLSKRHKDFSGDRKIKDLVKQLFKIHDQLKKHLDRLYPHGRSWD
jgi:hypothetical protein